VPEAAYIIPVIIVHGLMHSLRTRLSDLGLEARIFDEITGLCNIWHCPRNCFMLTSPSDVDTNLPIEKAWTVWHVLAVLGVVLVVPKARGAGPYPLGSADTSEKFYCLTVTFRKPFSF
jgi:hypothetical protein